MTFILAIVIGCLYASGIYMMMRKSIVKLIMGLALLSYATNLLIFTVGRLTRAISPIIPAGETTLSPPHADPLPQALILTAIVIGFGVTAFAVVLIKQTYQALGSDNIDDFRGSES